MALYLEIQIILKVKDLNGSMGGRRLDTFSSVYVDAFGVASTKWAIGLLANLLNSLFPFVLMFTLFLLILHKLFG